MPKNVRAYLKNNPGNSEVKAIHILSPLRYDAVIEGAKESSLLAGDSLARREECK